MSNIANNKFARRCTFRYSSTNYDFEMDSCRISVIVDRDIDKLAGGAQYTTIRGYYIQYDLSFRYLRRVGSAQMKDVVNNLFSSVVEFKPFPDATSYAVKLLSDEVSFAQIERQIMSPRMSLSLITTERLSSLPAWLDNAKQIT